MVEGCRTPTKCHLTERLFTESPLTKRPFTESPVSVCRYYCLQNVQLLRDVTSVSQSVQFTKTSIYLKPSCKTSVEVNLIPFLFSFRQTYLTRKGSVNGRSVIRLFVGVPVENILKRGF
jgi:hypothetical protein